MTPTVKAPKKLIEVALPLDAISEGCQQEKNPFLKGHPRGIHLWWARRPLAAVRAVIFGQLVNDPSWEWEMEHAGELPPNNLKASWAASRKRLFGLIKELVTWENMGDDGVLSRAKAEIMKSWQVVCELNKTHPQASEMFNPDKLPILYDPFAGGGAIPLEAQRLGLLARASDLNPVAVLINKAMIEIPSRFAGRCPVGPEIEEVRKTRKLNFSRSWPGTTGIVEDVRRYAAWLRENASKRLEGVYPRTRITPEILAVRPDLAGLAGRELNVIAWIWARTVRSPNPTFSHVEVPLASTFVLSTKNKVNAFVDPQISNDRYSFLVKTGDIPASAEMGTKATEKGADFRCIVSGVPISAEYIRSEGRAGRIGFKLLAIVAEGNSGRVYLSPSPADERLAQALTPTWQPDVEFFKDALGFRIGNYGLSRWSDLFTRRQLSALSCLCDLVAEARKKVEMDAHAAGWSGDQTSLEDGGDGARAYADAMAVYLAMGISHLTRYSCVRCGWNKTNENVAQAFGRQVMNMVWDFAEANPISGPLSVDATTKWVADALAAMLAVPKSKAFQADAQDLRSIHSGIIATDPPYYDNIGYGDLSDFFYVWLRRALQPVLPALFTTITTPKMEELVATPRRHGGQAEAEKFFLTGMTRAMKTLAAGTHPCFPVTIYYAFKQAETDVDTGTASTGWDTFLSAVLQAGFQVTGTLPVRSERTQGLKGKLNALASSVVLVCRKRPSDAPISSRRAFLRELNALLPEALDEMTKGSGEDRSPLAPVDLSQAIIGPGMAVF
jgi:putative DNA methylase